LITRSDRSVKLNRTQLIGALLLAALALLLRYWKFSG
jgi:hypothetical protein